MGPTKVPLHVLIIGGGIGGLCLAQGLRKSGISVAVYERDKSVHFRYQGYVIHMMSISRCASRGLFRSSGAARSLTHNQMV